MGLMTCRRALVCLFTLSAPLLTALALAACGAPSSSGSPDGGVVVGDSAALPIETIGCSVDLDNNALRCERRLDPIPGAADDESTTIVTMELAEDALDGRPHAIRGTADHVTLGLDSSGESLDTARLVGFTPSEAHDRMVAGVRVLTRVHLLHGPSEYERVDVEGTVTVDAAGAGHLSITWSDPPTFRVGAGSLEADLGAAR